MGTNGSRIRVVLGRLGEFATAFSKPEGLTTRCVDVWLPKTYTDPNTMIWRGTRVSAQKLRKPARLLSLLLNLESPVARSGSDSGVRQSVLNSCAAYLYCHY